MRTQKIELCCWVICSIWFRPVTRGGEALPRKFSPPLEKCVGHRLKLLDIVQKILAPLRKLFAPPGVPSWLPAWSGCSSFTELAIKPQTFSDTSWLLPVRSDGFTHRSNSSGPAQLFPMTTQYQLNFCETAQRHNFTSYLETSGNANVYARLLSIQ